MVHAVRLGAALLCVALPAVAAAQSETPPPRAFVLDSAARAVVVLDVTTGVTLGTVPLEGAPAVMLRSPDLSRLVVFDQTPGKPTVRFGFHPTAKTAVTVIDPNTLKALGRVEVGYNASSSPRAALFTPEGRRLAIFCAGYRSQKPAETLPRELVTLDLDTGQVAGRVALERDLGTLEPVGDGRTAVALAPGEEARKDAPAVPAEAFVLDLAGPQVLARVPLDALPIAPIVSSDRGTVAFFSQRRTPKKQPAVDARLQIFDAASRQVAATLTPEGAPEQAGFSPDGKFLYLLEKGRPSKKPEENINGRLQVYDVAARGHVTNLDAGANPQGLIADPEGSQVLLLSDGPPSKETGRREGEMRVLRGGDVAALVKVAASPNFLRIAPDRRHAYVVGDAALTYVDFVEMRPLAETPLKPAGINILASDEGKHMVSEIAISPDGRKGFALYQGSSKLTVLDLEEKRFVASVTTGRGGVKFGKFMGALALSAAMTAASASSSRSMAMSSGSRYYTYQVYNYQIRAPSTSLAVRPDGKFAYALNTQTNDVTVVDADTGLVVDKIAAGGQDVRLFTGGAMLAVRGRDTLHMIDTRTNKAAPDLAFVGSAAGVRLVFSKDGQHAVAAGGSVVYCLDGRTGAVRGRATGVKSASQVIVEAAEEEPEEEGDVVFGG